MPDTIPAGLTEEQLEWVRGAMHDARTNSQMCRETRSHHEGLDADHWTKIADSLDAALDAKGGE